MAGSDDDDGMRPVPIAAAGDAGPLSPGLKVRLAYGGYLFIGLVSSLALRGAMGGLLAKIPYLQEGCAFIGDHAGAVTSVCYGDTFVYRVSFALAVFFLLHFASVSDLTCCIDDDSRAELQSSFFCAKSALLALLEFGAFWVPNGFFHGYALLCLAASGVFLVVQVMLLVDFSYEWSEEWGRRSGESAKWSWYLLAVCAAAGLAGVAITGCSFAAFTPHGDCNLHGFLLIGNVLAAVVYTAVAVWVPHGSIVPSAIVFAYTSFVLLTALRVSPDTRCNRLLPLTESILGHGTAAPGTAAPGTAAPGLTAAPTPAPAGFHGLPVGAVAAAMREHGGGVAVTLASAVVTAGALLWTVVSTSGGGSHAAMAGESPRPRRGGGWGSAAGNLPAYCYFHGVMLLGSMYLAMLGTDWQISGGAAPGAKVTDAAAGVTAGFVVKVGTVGLTVGIYLWSLLAPYFCCRDRDFGYDVGDW